MFSVWQLKMKGILMEIEKLDIYVDIKNINENTSN